MLSTSLKYLQGIGPQRAETLKKELELETFADLLEYFPYRYEDRSQIYHTSDIHDGMPYIQICGEFVGFEKIKNAKGGTRIVGRFVDSYGFAEIAWFVRRFDPTKNLKVNTKYVIFGKPTMFQGVPQFAHPEIEEADKINLSEMGMQPHYHTTDRMKKAYFTSRVIEKLEKKLLGNLVEPLRETLPPFIVNNLHLMNRDMALRKIHYPKTTEEVAAATRRLKFEELFYVQINILRYATEHRNKYRGYPMPKVGDVFNSFYYKHLPFELTNAQKRVIRDVKNDIESGRQMNRLLQGDVGSGKTLVALMSMMLAIDNGFQACIIAPTEILAEQHLATIKEFIGDIPLQVELLTGIVKGKKRKQILEDLVTGKVNILVGTHAVLEDTVQFSNLGMVVVDEQHRFGVAQRAKLWGKNINPPHVLVMTATPIPRTLAMTIYGDLDVSIIDELPPGRKPVKTLHKYEDQLASIYEGIRYQIEEGRQVYVVFPLIQESKSLDLKNLEEGYNRLLEVFPEYRLSKVHGQMKSADKDAEMQKFVSGETQILVATTVIEVGVNVPNASVMLIFNSERFGLSQLHQLRGRVGRGASQSYCILLSKRELGNETRKRLDIMCESNDGFRIAEADLKLRGPGDLEGTQQSGMAFDLKIANIARDGELIQLARDEARKIIERDPQLMLPEHSIIKRRLQELKKSIVDWSAIS
ncbi:MAG: ATP-dependent DNA helicase RecG [Bacteroidaceae bacterium]|nr:ATP-dependent DNA helicase RecG [Bacteroidaceae bacterium]